MAQFRRDVDQQEPEALRKERNANGGQSSGPLEVDRPWDAYTDDHIGLMDHLRIEKFMVMGFCRRAFHLEPPEAGAESGRRCRVGAAQRIASGDADLFDDNNMKAGVRNWSSAGPRSP
jgi:hypothetical protein